MSLERYNQKRKFEQTPEPKGKVEQSAGNLIYVIQKHAASHLHYDFRIEINGVLKSWAVPKGPSMDPQQKRLAVAVEDHPYSYKDFEGSIPKGNYGAGEVIVWDRGVYTTADKTIDGNEQEKLSKGLAKGHLRLVLYGEKLKGEFSLVKLQKKEENNWLLIKTEDEYATSEDVLLLDKSVLSNQTLQNIKKNNTEKNAAESLQFKTPMLATSAKKPFDDSEWLFEQKFDGYRIVAIKQQDEIQLYSRNQISYTQAFKTIVKDLKKITHNVILDGEVVIENKQGKSDFQLLQNFIKTNSGNLKYNVFDILNLNGHDTTNLSLIQRKEVLEKLLKNSELELTHYTDHVLEKGSDFFAKAQKGKEEGIMAKKINSTYHYGQRSENWLKIKFSNQEEAIIVGITKPKNSRKFFGALLLANFQNDELTYIGKCGTGFTETLLKELYQKFEPYFTENNPLKEKVVILEKIQWMKPQFICSVKFAQWTKDKKLRQPVFIGLRNDKALDEIEMEKNNDISNNILIPDNYSLLVDKQELIFTNQNKIYFPQIKISKGEVIQYYDNIAEYILPYLKNRPQSLNRFPNGINKTGFYQKNIDKEKTPPWLTTQSIESDAREENIDYLVCNDKATLLYMANLGCIEMNPWNSTIKKLNNPDWLVIDLDPSTKNFSEVVEAALTVKEVMDSFDANCYCKTSGASGLHIYIPLGAKYTYESIKLFAQLIAQKVQEKLPEITTLERSVKKRGDRIYIDYLQNRRGQTIVAPYSIRPQPNATVSTPLDWSEVNDKLDPNQFTIKNILSRLQVKGDIWKNVLGPGIDIKDILKKLNH